MVVQKFLKDLRGVWVRGSASFLPTAQRGESDVEIMLLQDRDGRALGTTGSACAKLSACAPTGELRRFRRRILHNHILPDDQVIKEHLDSALRTLGRSWIRFL